MEKRGVIAPEVTPPEHADTAASAEKSEAVKSAEENRLKAIRELDGDFRKAASEATRKSLR